MSDLTEFEPDAGFESVRRIPLLPVVIALWATGVALVTISDLTSSNAHSSEMAYLLLMIFAGAIGIWQVEGRHPLAARGLTVAWLMLLIFLGAAWLEAPELLSLLVIPILLAAVLVGIPAAVGGALIATVVLLATPVFAGRVLDFSALVPVLLIWAVLGTACVLYYQVNGILRWTWSYFRTARDTLEEARDRKAELEQALDDLVHANEQLTRLNVLTQRLRQEAEEARAAKQRFVANVSHELRTPLNMVIGFSEMMLQVPESYGKGVPPAFLADLEVIHRNARHLSELVDDVLDLSQIEADQVALEREYTDFVEVVTAAVEAVRPLFESKGLYLRTDLPETRLPVYCDSTRTREVLLNLLSNAGRFTERGGVNVRVWQDENDVAVSVSDTGKGIAAQNLRCIFEPFRQADETIRRRFGGTGLGLAISKQFIELHEGRIWAESEVGVGTTISFRIPISPTKQIGGTFVRWMVPNWDDVARPQPSMASRPIVRPRYVVLERGSALQRLLAHHCGDAEIVPVKDVDTALRELTRGPCEALLTNELSVGEALQHVNYSAILPPGMPAILCSIPSDDAEIAGLGVAAHLVKPIFREELLGILDALGVESGTVLVVDDEPDALQLFGRMLASANRDYRVLLARHGQEALTILSDYGADVILLDLVMPVMDGFSFLEARRQDARLSELPVVLISARDTAGQPIVSNSLAITRGGGLSTRQLLACLEFAGRAFGGLAAPAAIDRGGRVGLS
jgi:signal transduction histidine kinase/CheY-like chemotaxis protein